MCVGEFLKTSLMAHGIIEASDHLYYSERPSLLPRYCTYMSCISIPHTLILLRKPLASHLRAQRKHQTKNPICEQTRITVISVIGSGIWTELQVPGWRNVGFRSRSFVLQFSSFVGFLLALHLKLLLWCGCLSSLEDSQQALTVVYCPPGKETTN